MILCVILAYIHLPLKKRGTGYGIFNTGYGIAMFLGSVLMGILYGYSVIALIITAVALEILAISLFFILRQEALRTSIKP